MNVPQGNRITDYKIPLIYRYNPIAQKRREYPEIDYTFKTSEHVDGLLAPDPCV
jgi:hypothetical protein